MVVGKEGRGAALLTFTERMTREEIIIKIPSKHAINISRSIDKLERKYKSEFKKKFKTITFDNGGEFRDYHKALLEIKAVKKTNSMDLVYISQNKRNRT